MKTILLPLSSLLLLTISHMCAQEEASAQSFVSLFDGKTLNGWKNPYQWGEAKVVDGEIQLTGNQKFFLITEKTYRDFVLKVEVHLPKGIANSGIMFRAQAKAPVIGYQCEVDGSDRNWTGGLYDEGRRAWFISPSKEDQQSIKAFEKRAGDTFKRDDWNQIRITCKGSHIVLEVNGVVTTDIFDEKDASGIIGIQHHGEKGQTYRFRNIRIKEL